MARLHSWPVASSKCYAATVCKWENIVVRILKGANSRSEFEKTWRKKGEKEYIETKTLTNSDCCFVPLRYNLFQHTCFPAKTRPKCDIPDVPQRHPKLLFQWVRVICVLTSQDKLHVAANNDSVLSQITAIGLSYKNPPRGEVSCMRPTWATLWGEAPCCNNMRTTVVLP